MSKCSRCHGSGKISRGGQWYRPGPEAESRILGLRPSRGSDSIWSESLWAFCEKNTSLKFPLDTYPEIGCDVSRVLGGDDCCIVGQWGGIILVYDYANGRPLPGTAARIKEIADDLCTLANRERAHLISKGAQPFYGHRVKCKIDDGAAGWGVIDLAYGYQFIPVSAGATANADLKYPNARSELWFDSVDRAMEGGVSFAHLDDEATQTLKIQAMAPLWAMDARDRRVVEKKELTKKRLGRSPDAMDALNLSLYRASRSPAEWIGETPTGKYQETMGAKLGLLGRGRDEEEEKHIGRLERESRGGVKLWGKR